MPCALVRCGAGVISAGCNRVGEPQASSCMSESPVHESRLCLLAVERIAVCWVLTSSMGYVLATLISALQMPSNAISLAGNDASDAVRTPTTNV